jgi:acetylornithine deacetylase/succinyl-diaminopimelate desuccinylase-like protein
MTTPFEYGQENREKFVEQLKDLLRIPSVSSSRELVSEVRRAAEWLRDECLAVGMTTAEIVETAGHPVVYAEWLGAGADVPTVLVYGHYDVQPVDDPRKEWRTDPFDPTEINGNLYARGATDDKGQAFIHLKAFEAFMKTTGKFPLNFKIMLEGEEEEGSTNLAPFINDYLERLSCDVVVISDSDVFSETQPSMVYGLRGLVYTEVEIFGPKSDLHSGSYGGAVHNPAQVLVEILAKMHDEQGRITIPGFYNAVLELSSTERAALAESPESDESLYQLAGVPQGWGEEGYTAIERVGGRPTLEINGLRAGWTGDGAKTVIGATAMAKVSCRLVPNQQPGEILELIREFVAAHTPPTCRSEVRIVGGMSPGVVVPMDSKPMQSAAAAYEAVFGKKPFFNRSGGSIPVVVAFQELLHVPVLLMGFGLPDDNLHAPNEKFTLSMFHRGIQTMLHLYQDLPAAL